MKKGLPYQLKIRLRTMVLLFICLTVVSVGKLIHVQFFQYDFLSQKAEVEAAVSKVINAKELDLFLFVVTDILTNDSTVLAIGSKADVVEKAYNVKLENQLAVLKGVVSRKKQIVPILTNTFATL